MDPRKEFKSRIFSVINKRKKLKEHIWDVIDLGKGKMGRRINTFLFITIIVSLLILPLEFFAIFQPYHFLADMIEVLVTAIFTVEYALRVYSAPRKLRYIFSWWGLIDLLSILPYYITLAHSNTHMIRFVRIVRIFKIAQMKSNDEVELEVRENSHKKVKLMQNEVVERVVMQHPIFFILGLILPLLFGTTGLVIMILGNFSEIALAAGVVFALFMGIFLYKAWVDYHYDVMYITNYRLIFQNEHLFGRSNNQIEYRDITNIRPMHQGIFAFLLGYGSLIIETASDQSGIHHENVRKHEQVAQHIHEKCKCQKEGITNTPRIKMQK